MTVLPPQTIFSPFPSMLVVRHKGDCGCRCKLYSSRRILTKLRCKRPDLGSKDVCEFFEVGYQLLHRWQQHPDHRHSDHLGDFPAFMVLRAAACDSPLISSWKNFPWSKSLFSFIQKILEWQLFSTKPVGNTNTADQPVGTEGREESHLVTSKITKFSSLLLSTILLSCFHRPGGAICLPCPSQNSKKSSQILQ